MIYFLFLIKRYITLTNNSYFRKYSKNNGFIKILYLDENTFFSLIFSLINFQTNFYEIVCSKLMKYMDFVSNKPEKYENNLILGNYVYEINIYTYSNSTSHIQSEINVKMSYLIRSTR